MLRLALQYLDEAGDSCWFSFCINRIKGKKEQVFCVNKSIEKVYLKIIGKILLFGAN